MLSTDMKPSPEIERTLAAVDARLAVIPAKERVGASKLNNVEYVPTMLPTVTVESIVAAQGVGLYLATLIAALHLRPVDDDQAVVWHML